MCQNDLTTTTTISIIIISPVRLSFIIWISIWLLMMGLDETSPFLAVSP